MKNTFIAVLESESGIKNISKDDLESRKMIVEGLQSLPREAIINLRHLLPQAGCLNACSFCSQNAIPKVWQLTEPALRNVFSALKTVGLSIACGYSNSSNQSYLQGDTLSPEGVFLPTYRMPAFGLVGYGRTEHRPGVIYPYFDNDVASYPYFLQYMKYAKEDLGVKVRLSTVGYSRRNTHLQQMHEQINKDHLEDLGGVRVSLTPYTLGWTTNSERSGLTSREEFGLDLTNLLTTYSPAIQYLGAGDRSASVEFRFPPLISNVEVKEDIILKHHVIQAGPYMLISRDSVETLSQVYTARLNAEGRHSLRINERFVIYTMIISPILIEGGDWKMFTRKIIESDFKEIDTIIPEATMKESKLYHLENDDGFYYAIDPEMTEFGHFAKQFYPITESRITPGYIDSERYFLNILLKHKRTKGIGRREQFVTATWQDTDEVIKLLEEKSQSVEVFNPSVAHHIKLQILPLVTTYRKALEESGLPASYFFDKNFTIDTGEICNLGGAFREFKGLTSRKNSVITTQHDRVYSPSGSLATEGCIWTIGVSPMIPEARCSGIPSSYPALYVQEQDLKQRSSANGCILRKWYIPLRPGDVETLNSSHHKSSYLIPGRKV
jgi:hypothetical protein